MAHANAIHIQKYLKGVDYPATREELIENARSLGADDSVCASLEQLPDEDFQTPAEVSQAFKGPSSNEVKRGEDKPVPSGIAHAQGQQKGTAEFLIQVVEDSLAEMELCLLALDHASRDEVKVFAQGMLHEHGKLGQQLEKMAQSMQVTFPKKMRPEHVKLIREMTQLKGEAFDQRFAAENVRYHENDLKVFTHYAGHEVDEKVRKMAGAGVKLFEKHLKMATDLQRELRR